jgi:hypothetical protein
LTRLDDVALDLWRDQKARPSSWFGTGALIGDDDRKPDTAAHYE